VPALLDDVGEARLLLAGRRGGGAQGSPGPEVRRTRSGSTAGVRHRA
jgi:hypothetical protein